MVYRQFLLRGAKFGVEEFDGDALGLQRFQDRVYDFSLVVQANTAVTEAAICGYIFAVLFTRKIKFVLYGCLGTHAMFGQSRSHAFEEGTRACFPGLAIRENHIAHHTAAARHIG